ncbi:MAG: hypothetical protein NTZ48_04695 [Candidatus Omnitrophica bacterium]|nr:hypothetical protein [Candidatus Omnitrophota bacterium]
MIKGNNVLERIFLCLFLFMSSFCSFSYASSVIANVDSFIEASSATTSTTKKEDNYEETPVIPDKTGVSDNKSPSLNISALDDVLNIPVNGTKVYSLGTENMQGVTGEDIFKSLSNLTILTMGNEGITSTQKDINGNDELIVGGELGVVVNRELLGYSPSSRFVAVFNKGTWLLEGASSEEICYVYDILTYIGDVVDSSIRVYLTPYLAHPERGFDLRVFFIENVRRIDETYIRNLNLGIGYPDLNDLPDADPNRLLGVYKDIKMLDTEPAQIIEWQGILFQENNPDPIGYRTLGP